MVLFYFFYYFPLGLDLRLRRRVWATWALVGACVFVFMLQRLAPMLVWRHWESLVFVPATPRLSALVLNAYLHGGWLHLVSNMISLIVFAPALEERLGARHFLVLYHACNVLANIVQGAIVLVFLPPLAHSAVLGASGAIAGVLGLCCMRLYFARLRIGYWAFMPLQAYTRGGVAMVPAAFAITIWFGIQLGMALLQAQGVAPGVACGSHLGGLLAGVAFGLLLHLPTEARTEQYLHGGRRYLDAAQWYAAQGEFIEYVRRQPKKEEGHLELARTYRLTGRHAQADHHYRIACHLLAEAKRLDRVEEVYREAERGSSTFTLGEPQQIQLAKLLERSYKPDAAQRAYVGFANRYPTSSAAPLAIYRAARLMERDAATAWRAGSLHARLAEQYPFSNEAALARTALQSPMAQAA